MAALFVLKRIGPGYFFLARFWRAEIPWREKRQHFNESQFRQQVNRLNHPRYQKISQHKVVEKAVLTLHGLATPAFIGFFHSERGSDASARPLCSADDLQRFLPRYAGRRVCFKAAEGSGGMNFAAMDVIERDGEVALRHPLSSEVTSIADWSKRLAEVRSGWILEEFLAQHPVLAALNPDSVNTLRLIVLHTREGFVTRGAVLRVGRVGSQVDNTSSGGLACRVDLGSGEIVEALDLTPDRNNHMRHPDTGATLVGIRIPHWQACVAVAGKALAAFPHMNFAGVDIALTEDGPAVIELNVHPDRRFAAHLDLPHARLFAGR